MNKYLIYLLTIFSLALIVLALIHFITQATDLHDILIIAVCIGFIVLAYEHLKKGKKGKEDSSDLLKKLMQQ